jgi:3-methylfumaryl-CoA hydratase
MTEDAQTIDDQCTAAMAGRVAATLGLEPAAYAGGLLPRGWHVGLFTVATPHGALRPDGLGSLGFVLPQLGLPRLVAGGRSLRFGGDIPIGAAVRRTSRLGPVAEKQGRSGRLAVVSVEHEIVLAGGTEPVLVERQDYVMLPEALPTPMPAPTPPPAPVPAPSSAAHERVVVPDEALLLRYCAITFNTHRIHYDLPYARDVEGYPALVVNGGLPVLFLLQMFREEAGREPARVTVRNAGLLFCNRPMRLRAQPGPDTWRLWAEDPDGRVAVEMTAA